MASATGKQVIFHVGTAKTGTTHLQHLLARRADSLRHRYELLYPEQWRVDDGYAHHGLPRQMLAGELDVDATLEEFRRMLDDPGTGSVLVSSEAFTNVLTKDDAFAVFLELLLRLRRYASVKLVVVLREYASFIESMYLHQVKVGDVTQSFDEYLAKRTTWFGLVTERLATLRRLAGIVELSVLAYDDESVVAKMERLLSVDLEEGPVRGRTAQKLSLKSQALLYRLDQFPQLASLDRAELVDFLASNQIFSADSTDYTLFSPATRALTSRVALDAAVGAGIEEYRGTGADAPVVSTKQFVVLDDVPLAAHDIESLMAAFNGASSQGGRAQTGAAIAVAPAAAGPGGKKIIALLAGKNEAPRLEFCIRALSLYCDSIVYFDDNSEDDSVAIVESIAGECRVERIIGKTDERFHETIRRAQPLAAGRELGGTHFVVIDVDEAFTANCLDGDYLRQTLLSLSPGDTLEVPYFELWRSVRQYRDDDSMWSNKSRVIAFADDGQSQYEDKFIHLQRVPSGLAGQSRRLADREHGLMHFQFVNWRNLLVKQAWYRCLEHVNDPSKPIEVINALYAPTKDETGLRLSDVPDVWVQGYPFLDPRRLQEADSWRERQVLAWFERFGVAYFEDLDIWDVEWGQGLGRTPVSVPRGVLLRREVDHMVADAEQLQAGGNLAEAEQRLTHLMEQHPGHWVVPNDLGVLRACTGDLAGAESLLQRARELDPYQPEAAINMARLHQANGCPEEGVALLQEFVRQHPNSPHARQYVRETLSELQQQRAASVPADSRGQGQVSVDAGATALDLYALQQLAGRHPVLEVQRATNFEEYKAHRQRYAEHYRHYEQVENSLIQDEDEFTVPGYCYICGHPAAFQVDFAFGGQRSGHRIPNWRERLVCPDCGLNNRLRASVHLFEQLCGVKPGDRVYITEQVSPLYSFLSARYPNLVGSEYLAEEVPFGKTNGDGIRNESLLELTFAADSLDHILSFDVFEHIPDYLRAFGECLRCLKPGGHLLFSVPFALMSADNIVRATVGKDGEVEHLLPPEYHGNPIDPEGCLCFYHFGWKLLEELRAMGYDDVAALCYWSAESGYLGGEQVVFTARKPERVLTAV